MYSELWILCRKRVQVFSKQNIFLVYIGEDQINFCRISPAIMRPSPNDCSNNLQHRCYSSPTSNHPKMSHKSRCVNHCALWTFDLERLPNFKSRHIFRDITGRVCFDQEIKVALIFIRGDGGVGANDFFGLAFNGRSNGNVLANW